MLLTVNGEADNGKDYVADWCAREFDLVKIALADPMKRFCRHLFGFPAENLWGPSDKRNELVDAAPLWNTAFTQLHTLHQFTAAVVPEELGPDVRAKAFAGIQTWFTNLRKQYPEKISARITLQTLGTEWGRDIHPDLWIDYLFGVQLPLLAQGYLYTAGLGIRKNVEPEAPKNGIVIPDQRFVNELGVSESRGGYSLRTRRLSRVKTDGSNIGIQGHQSEQEQKGIPDSRFKKVFNFPEGLEIVDQMLYDWACSEFREERAV
jgi:hypothetical protein